MLNRSTIPLPGNSFFNIFHPLNHFCLPHKVDILDERIIFLPESHFGGLLLDLKDKIVSKKNSFNFLFMLRKV